MENIFFAFLEYKYKTSTFSKSVHDVSDRLFTKFLPLHRRSGDWRMLLIHHTWLVGSSLSEEAHLRLPQGSKLNTVS